MNPTEGAKDRAEAQARAENPTKKSKKGEVENDRL